MPTEIKTEFSMDEKRRSLKKVGDAEDHYDTPKRPTYKEPEVLPPYRPSPPAEEVPTKVLSLQERMSKFQQKVVSQPPKVYFLSKLLLFKIKNNICKFIYGF